jgi:hypothetical protein
MDLVTVIANLKRTISGKELLLARYKKSGHPQAIKDVTEQFLTINIDELKRILADLEEIK